MVPGQTYLERWNHTNTIHVHAEILENQAAKKQELRNCRVIGWQ